MVNLSLSCCTAARASHTSQKMQASRVKADARFESGAYAEASTEYEVLIQDGRLGQAVRAELLCHLAACLVHTGQYRQVTYQACCSTLKHHIRLRDHKRPDLLMRTGLVVFSAGTCILPEQRFRTNMQAHVASCRL